MIFLLLFVVVAQLRTFAVPSQWAVAVFPSGEEFTLELAVDDATRRTGYMYRDKIGSREGMLFVFENSAHHGIWMKNCKTALDIIWLDKDFDVLQIAHSQPPCPAQGSCPTMMPMHKASYVLEVAGGTSGTLGLEPGNRLTILAEPPLP